MNHCARSLRVQALVASFALATGSAWALPDAARDLEGARSVLTQVKQQLERAAPEPVQSPKQRFEADLEDFAARAATMNPKQAAAEWLDLYERFLVMPDTALLSSGYQRLEMKAVFAALPPPPAWPALAAHAETLPSPTGARRAERTLLRALSGVLLGDTSLLAEVLTEARTLQRDPGLPNLRWGLNTLVDHLEAVLDDRRSKVEAFREALAADPPPSYLQVPVEIAQEPEELLRKDLLAILNFRPFPNLPANEHLREQARVVALENLHELDRAPWSLASGEGGLELFKALDRRFPLEASSDSETDLAQLDQAQAALRERAVCYLPNWMAAIAAGDEEAEDLLWKRLMDPKATQLVSSGGLGGFRSASLPQPLLDAVVKAGRTRDLFDGLEALLAARPGFRLWKAYRDLGLSLGLEEQVLRTLKDARGAAETTLRRELRSIEFDTLLAVGLLDRAGTLLREGLAAGDTEAPEHLRRDWGRRWMRIGHLTGDTNRFQEGLGILQQLVSDAEASGSRGAEAIARTLAIELKFSGHLKAAEAALARTLALTLKAKGSQNVGQVGVARPTLTALARLYHDAGRPADVLALLEESPYWDARDLLELAGTTHTKEVPLLTIAGAAAAQQGRPNAAELLEVALLHHPGNDDAYEAYVNLRRQAAIPFLDWLRRRDPLEERPWIWKAQLLLDSGKVDEAEAEIRHALTLDPSDGEQGKGDRMRGYAVLADVLAAKGQLGKAEGYRRAVRAIRAAEHADDFHQVGMVRESLRRYEAALGVFSEAYCVQSRLAMRYAELGALDDARRHYHKAFELMPSSFGYRESHCFGCEGVFRGELAQSIAEEVLTRLAGSDETPQVRYLLGYLRNEQGRNEEAREAFLAATRAGPGYFNAWDRLARIRTDARPSSQVLKDAARSMVRLDPVTRHHSTPYGGIGLTELWREAEAVQDLSRARPKALLPLAASARQLDALRSLDGSAPVDPSAAFRQRHHVFEMPRPGEVLARHEALQAISLAFQNLRGQLR